MIKLRRKAEGFTLIEILIAIGIVGISLLAILPMIIVASSQITQAKYKNLAVHLAQNEIEEIIHMDYAKVTDNFPTKDVVSNGMTFTVQVDVDEGNDSGTFEIGDQLLADGMKLIVARVSWSTPGGQLGRRYVETSTLLYNH